MDFISKNPNPKFSDVLQFIRNNNKNGRYDMLLDEINGKNKAKELDNIIDWIKNNNKDGRFNKLLNYISTLSKPKLTDILNFIHNDPDQGKYKELMKKIMNQPLTKNELLDSLIKFNKDGKFDDIISLIRKNPNMTMDQLV